MPIPAPQIVNAEIIVYGQIAAGGGQTKNTANVFHYRRLATVIGPSKVDLDTIFQSTVVAKLLLATNARWSQLRNSIRWINDANDAPFEISHPNAGAIGTAGMTGNEVATIRLRTALRGKSYRGAKHFGPLSEADTTAPDDDVFNAAAITRWTDVATALTTDLVAADGNTWRSQVLSRLLSGLETNPTNVVANDITSATLNTVVRDMKSRRIASVY